MSTGLQRARKIVLGIAALAFSTALPIAFIKVPTTFDVNARTETLTLLNNTGRWLDLALRNALLVPREAFSPEIPFSGRVSIAPSAEVHVERFALGPLFITCRQQLEAAPVVRLVADGSTTPMDLAETTVFRVDQVPARMLGGGVIVIPLTGQITLGREVIAGGLNSGVLRDGRIDVIGHSLLGNSRFDAGSTQLDLGDIVTVEGEDPFPALVEVNEQPALSISLRAVAKRALVRRFGAQGYELNTSVAARVLHDSALQVLWGTCLRS